VIGSFIGESFRRLRGKATHVYGLKDLTNYPARSREVDVFVQEKWKIAGDTPGSGNTTNIGSISGILEEFERGAVVFESEE